MNSSTNLKVLSNDQEDFLSFQREFDQSVKDLAIAIASSQEASASAKDISQKGTWKMFVGSVNGENTKELAQMTGKLASSLKLTQTVLQVIMKISHRKNGFLKQFHETLVNKIANLSADTKTLDSNQREATIAILEEIDNHIAGQLAQSDMVDRHEKQLESVELYIQSTDIQLAGFSSKIDELHTRAPCIDQAIDILQSDTIKAKNLIDDQERLSKRIRQIVSKLETTTATHNEQLQELSSTATAQGRLLDEQRTINDQQRQKNYELSEALETARTQIATLADRIEILEFKNAQAKAFKRMLLRNSPAIAAFILAAIALLLAYPHFPRQIQI